MRFEDIRETYKMPAQAPQVQCATNAQLEALEVITDRLGLTVVSYHLGTTKMYPTNRLLDQAVDMTVVNNLPNLEPSDMGVESQRAAAAAFANRFGLYDAADYIRYYAPL